MYKVFEKIYNYLVTLRGVDSDTLKTLSDQIDGVAPASEYDTEMARITANVATEAKQDIIDTNVDDIETAVGALNDINAATVEAECEDALQAWLVDVIAGVAGPGVPVVDSYLDFIMNINVGQTFNRATDSLEALSIAIAGIGGSVSALQILETDIDLHQAAATYDIATCGVNAIIIESITFSSQLNITDDAGAFTAVTIQTDQATEQEFMDNVDGAKAELTAENQYAWVGKTLLRVGDKIQFTIEGGTAEIDPSDCDVIIEWRAVAAGATLA